MAATGSSSTRWSFFCEKNKIKTKLNGFYSISLCVYDSLILGIQSENFLQMLFVVSSEKSQNETVGIL